MEKEQIYNKLSEKYDKYTTELLTDSIFEFQELFKEKYYTTENVINAVIENIPKGVVVYDDLGEKYDAICSITSGEFKVGKNTNKENNYFKYVFFHEFLHSISFKKHGDMQFMGFYTIEKGEDYDFKSRSFNEAFTEFMTLKRNKMCNYELEKKALSGYDVGANKIQLLTKIIPEEELIDCYFNSPNNLEELLKKYNMSMDEIFYSFYLFEGMEYDIKALEARVALSNPQNVFRIIDAERYLQYNLLDSFGDIKNEEEFNKKWNILLSEKDSKYNFYNIDGIFRYGELCNDIDKLNIKESKFITEELLDKYRLLNKIFSTEDKMSILEELYKIYKEDYKKYWNLLKDDFAPLAYTFLDKLKNNYQLYDIEIYPRGFQYIKKEQADIKDIDYGKLICEEEKIMFYLFYIKNKLYIESNYDDTVVSQIGENEFEVKYGDQTGKIDTSDSTYEINNNKYKLKRIY